MRAPYFSVPALLHNILIRLYGVLRPVDITHPGFCYFYRFQAPTRVTIQIMQLHPPAT